MSEQVKKYAIIGVLALGAAWGIGHFVLNVI